MKVCFSSRPMNCLSELKWFVKTVIYVRIVTILNKIAVRWLVSCVSVARQTTENVYWEVFSSLEKIAAERGLRKKYSLEKFYFKKTFSFRLFTLRKSFNFPFKVTEKQIWRELLFIPSMHQPWGLLGGVAMGTRLGKGLLRCLGVRSVRWQKDFFLLISRYLRKVGIDCLRWQKSKEGRRYYKLSCFILPEPAGAWWSLMEPPGTCCSQAYRRRGY